MKRVEYPDGVENLMMHLWLRHKSGKSQDRLNCYTVDFPPISEKERAEMRKGTVDDQNYTDEELYGTGI
ncbi:MAG: hypothetical protein K2K52_00905 [Paramuribaculum sp.]|nr:hypothetical protein [Paramuribaculum sp.]MDE6459379.1 hypothetical protein [Paramuribaculum sp.]